jgi:hypothetical protein
VRQSEVRFLPFPAHQLPAKPARAETFGCLAVIAANRTCLQPRNLALRAPLEGVNTLRRPQRCRCQKVTNSKSTKIEQALRAGGKEPTLRPFLAGPADRCRVHTYLVCRTELQMVCRQLQADWTSDFVTDRIQKALSAFRLLKRQVDDSKTMRQLAATGQDRATGDRLRKLVAKY